MSDGVLYVEIVPSTKGIGKGITSELDQQLAGSEKKSQSVFGKMAKWGVAAVAAVGLAVGGLALAGGISRALNIEDAQAKLKGLGHDTKSVEAIMTDALGAVRGTAFGLDTAATVAASAVAAGIKPGKELEGYLRLTADAATIAGISMDEMGSIMNKVQTNGRAMTENLNQLSDRGIPILQWLAEEYGVTTEEMSKMVSQGKVDAETFNRVLQENIGGAALESGNTTRGAFANMRAALGRLGAMFAGPGIGVAKTLFQELTVVIDAVAGKLKPLAGAFASMTEGLNLEGMGERFAAFLDSFDVGSLVAAVGQGRAALIDAGVKLLGGLIDGAIQALPQIVTTLVGMVEQIVSLIATQGPALAQGAVTLFLGLVAGLLQVLPQMLTTVLGLVPIVVEALIGLLPELITGAVTLFQGIVQAVIEVIPELIAMVVTIVPEVITALIGLIPILITGAIDLFMAIVEAIPEIIPPLIQAIVDLLPVLITSVFSLIPALLDGAIKLFIAIVKAVPVIIPALIDAVLNLLPVLIRTVIGLIPQLINAAIQLFEALVKAIPIIIPALIDAVIKIGPKLVDAVIKMVPMLLNAGKDLIRGLGDGIASMGQWILDQIGKVVGGAVNWAKDLLGIASPSKVFFELGEWTSEGFADGITAESASVHAAVDHMVAIPDMSQISSPSGQSGFGVAEISDPVMDRLAAKIAAAILGLRNADGRAAQLATMQGVR